MGAGLVDHVLFRAGIILKHLSEMTALADTRKRKHEL